MMEVEISAKIRQAAEVLDELKPGWEGRIDCEKLNLQSSTWCVCGQVFLEEAEEFTINERKRLTATGKEGPYVEGLVCNGWNWASDQKWYGELMDEDVFADDMKYRDQWIALVKERMHEGMSV